MDTTEFDIKLTEGRIVNVIAKRISDNEWKLIIETEISAFMHKRRLNFVEDTFALVEASTLSLDDEFMQYEPATPNQKELKRAIEIAIRNGVQDFFHSPEEFLLYDENEDGSICEVPIKCALSYKWWDKEAKNLCPKRGSRLGTPNEYYAFIGAIIKDIVAHGFSISKAWHAVCDDLNELKYLWEHMVSNQEYSQGARKKIFWGPFDFAKNNKILAKEDDEGFWMTGVNYQGIKNFNPLTSVVHIGCKEGEYFNTTGWVVLPKQI